MKDSCHLLAGVLPRRVAPRFIELTALKVHWNEQRRREQVAQLLLTTCIAEKQLVIVQF